MFGLKGTTRLAVVAALLAVGLPLLAGESDSGLRANAAGARQPGSSSRGAMINILGSSAPNPALGDEAQAFDRFVGTWDADFSFRRDDGTVRHNKGELHFGWVLDGR